MLRLLIAVFCALALVPKASAQQFDFSGTAVQDPEILSTAVINLATEVLPVYKEADRETYLTNLAALQAAAGRYDQAAQSYEALRDFRRSAHISNSEWRDLQFEIYDHAKARAKGFRQGITDELDAVPCVQFLAGNAAANCLTVYIATVSEIDSDVRCALVHILPVTEAIPWISLRCTQIKPSRSAGQSTPFN